MKPSATISGTSLFGMIVVSCISIVLLGLVWGGKMYLDFLDQSQTLRANYYAAQKDLIRTEVQKGVALVDEIRRTKMKELWRDVRDRAYLAQALAEELSHSAVPGLTPDAIRRLVEEGMRATHGHAEGIFSLEGNTLFLVSPFLSYADPGKDLNLLDKAFDGVGDGDRRVSVVDSDGTGYSILLAHVRHLKSPAMKIVSAACLEEAEDVIKDYAVERLEAIRFGVDGTFFGGTWKGVSMVGPVKGKDMWDVTDAQGVKIVQELVAASKRGGGFVSYIMPKLGDRRSLAKVSYAEAIPDWQWYIGVGVYVDDIEQVIVQNRQRLEKEISYHFAIIVAALLVLSLVAYSLSRRFARRVQRHIEYFTGVWNQSSSAGTEIDPSRFHFQEFKDLAVAANRMSADRQAAEAGLVESGARFQTLVSNIPGIVYHCNIDKHWTMQFISDFVEDLTGYPSSDFINNAVRSYDSIIYPDDILWVNQAKGEGVTVGRPFSLEYRIIRADGEIRWLFDRGQPRYDAKGEPLWLDGVIFDITEKRQAEEKHYTYLHFLETMERIDRDVRRNSDMEAMLAKTMETVRQAFGADRSWLLYPCDPAESTYRIPVENSSTEIDVMSVAGMDLPINEEAVEVLSMALSSSGPVAYDPSTGLSVPKDVAERFGIKSQLVVAIYPILGKPWLMGMHQCRTERIWNPDEIQLFKEASRRVADALSNVLMYRELKESEEKFRTFSEQTSLGIGVVQDNVVMFANKSYCDIFEMEVAEMLALPPGGFIKLVHPDDREFLMNQARKKQAGDSDIVPTYQWRAVTKTGRVRWVEIHSRTVTLGGRNAVLISLLDITEQKLSRDEQDALVAERTADLARKATELELANVQLRRLDALKSSFLSTVSHDLRTPLTSVLGYAKLVRRDLDRSLKDMGCADGVDDPKKNKIINNLKIIENEGWRLTELMDEFLDLTSIEAETAIWNDSLVSVEEILEKVLAAFETDFALKPELTFDVSLEEPLPVLKIDPVRLEQVLGQVVENAIKYTMAGTISIHAGCPDGHFMLISVSDTGKGIPDGDLQTIFDAFHQVEYSDTLTSTDKGAGLGLTLCRAVVEHYGGSIWAESDMGRGSTFFIKLPVQQGA